MAKKKKTAKKKAKKKSRKKKRDPLHQLPQGDPLGNLHAKKLEIMGAVPIVPCSAVAKDRQGRMFCHTQAEKIFQVYQEKLIEKKLTIRPVKFEQFDTDYNDGYYLEGKWQEFKTPCQGVVGTFEITDTDSGQSEQFQGAALGDNAVWSLNSAQTVAYKQAVIMYFFNAWPQPLDYSKVIRDELTLLPFDGLVNMMKQIIPAEQGHKILTNKKARDELIDFYAKTIGTKKNKKE